MQRRSKQLWLTVGLIASGFAAAGLAFVAFHDHYKQWVSEAFPDLWRWASSGCHIGRMDAIENVPAMVLIYIGAVAFWFAKDSTESKTVLWWITSVLWWLAATMTSLITLFWVLSLAGMLPGSC